LVSNFAALEQYYQREGRDWERYALIKARVVAGDEGAGTQLLSILKPFVYRRYIDFGAIEALRDMHQSIREDALRNDRSEDIKRGPGGIREIEFLVQTFQLLRGGREPGLQTPSIMKAIDSIARLQLLPRSSIDALLEAYRFLRRVENRIQALHDQQTHRVPAGQDGQRVARAMGFEDTTTFARSLARTRQTVTSLFENSLPQPPGPADEKNPWHIRWQAIRQGKIDLQGQKHLLDFASRLDRLALSRRASRRLDQFMPLLLEKFETSPLPDAVVGRVLDLVSAICRRSAYLSLLVQHPEATGRLLELFKASHRVAEAVTRYPALLDEVIDPSLGAHTPSRADIEAGVQRVMGAGRDTETTLQELNYYKRVMSLRVAVAVLQSTLSVFEARYALAWLAEYLVQAVLTLARSEIAVRHGQLPGPELCVVAYGSLGARSLGFDSDLDLVFLYEPGTEKSDGPRPITPERYHTGVARRLLGLLSATTPSGRLYSIDARLRPNGRAGLLVSSVAAFARYQAEDAWIWELQALTRARPVAGNRQIADKFSDIRQRVLCGVRDEAVVKQEVRDMRDRIKAEHRDPDSVKHGDGGLLDIEFVVQSGVLVNANKFPELVTSTELIEQLKALNETGLIGDQVFNTLDEAYSALSQAQQRIELVSGNGSSNDQALLEFAKGFCEDILR
jgi:glutamate-ammonia-ligase adenylyltransferase